jgi:ribosomal protein S21
MSFRKPPREKEFRGYYVDCSRYGFDAIRGFRKLKRMYKETRYFEEMREREYYKKPSEIKRETLKRKKQTLWKLQKSRDEFYTPHKKHKK